LSEALSFLLLEAGFSVCALTNFSADDFSKSTVRECDAIVLTDPAFKAPLIVALEKIQSANSGVPVVLVSATRSCSSSLLFKYSIRAILSKDAEVHDLYTALKQVSAGDHYVSPTVAEKLASDLCYFPTEGTTLSSRETEILILIANGASPNEIAAALSISAKTVSTHKNNIKSRLGLRSTSDIIQYAIKEGWVTPQQ
jgi:DNA-binding NarL/FixJ family response regulator